MCICIGKVAILVFMIRSVLFRINVNVSLVCWAMGQMRIVIDDI